MTTRDRPIEVTDSYDESHAPVAATPSTNDQAAQRIADDPQTTPTEPMRPTVRPSSEPAPAVADQRVAPADGVAYSAEAPAIPADHPSVEHESVTEEDLFADDELAELRARWAGVQAGFVDDPKECVQKADVLVSDLVEQLTSGFAQARSRLEEQWARGEQASTEDLRLALMHYREFFERLLAV